jgi:hypothetical protein
VSAPTGLVELEQPVAKQRLERECPEREHHLHASQDLELASEEVPAAVPLVVGGPIVRRGAAHGGGDEGSRQLQAISVRRALRLIREAGAMECAEKEVAGSVAGEHPPRAICPVRGGSKPDDQQFGSRVAEARDGASPVPRRIAEASWVLRRRLAPDHESFARSAGGYLAGECFEVLRR